MIDRLKRSSALPYSALRFLMVTLCYLKINYWGAYIYGVRRFRSSGYTDTFPPTQSLPDSVFRRFPIVGETSLGLGGRCQNCHKAFMTINTLIFTGGK